MTDEATWRQKLTADQFCILREGQTERAFTSKLNDEKRAGVYQCAGCGAELFESGAKFDSGSGWPSFFQPVPNAIAEDVDYKLGYARREIKCAACDGHLGHVFNDGPAPTGQRYCVNGLALTFKPLGF